MLVTEIRKGFSNKLKKVLGIVALLLIFSPFAQADVDWSVKKQFNLERTLLDTALSSDGQMAYVLTRGEIAVYSLVNDKVLSRIPVDKTFNLISHSAQTNTLMVSSTVGKTIRFIHLELLHKFDMSGLALKGSQNAPVTIAVFSDYQ